MTCRVRAVTFDGHAGGPGSAVGVDAIVTELLGAASGPRGVEGALHAVARTARLTTRPVISDQQDPMLR